MDATRTKILACSCQTIVRASKDSDKDSHNTESAKFQRAKEKRLNKPAPLAPSPRMLRAKALLSDVVPSIPAERRLAISILLGCTSH